VFELEDTDINPIGCISGKNCIVRARNYDEVCGPSMGFCRTRTWPDSCMCQQMSIMPQKQH
jgi:hypothetical protein